MMLSVLLVSTFLVLIDISCVTGHPSGVEFKEIKSCGPNAKIEVTPWPFIRSGEKTKVTVTFTPAVDVFAATFEYVVKLEGDSQIVARGRDNACNKFPELCSLPAGETHVWTYSDVMRAFPPGLKGNFKGTIKLFNEEHILFLCFEVVATIQ